MKSSLTKLAFIAPASVIHTIKWVNGLVDYGFEVHLITQHTARELISSKVIHHQLPYRGAKGYVLNAFHLNRLISKISPDVINVHYASGYGTLASLSRIKPYVLSIWGSDVYEFPYHSFFHQWLIKSNLNNADKLASTSHAMAEQIHQFSNEKRDIAITPFGVDFEYFSLSNRIFSSETITIGVVKRMEGKYGLDILIHSFNHMRNQLLAENSEYAKQLRLLIVGGGALTDELQLLVDTLSLTGVCQIVGAVPHSEVPSYINKIDLFVVSSRIESFGVSVVEAAACERACVVSDVGGLPEVVIDGETGYVVASESIEQFSNALIGLVKNKELAITMGKEAREFAIAKYSESLTMSIMSNMLKGCSH